MLLFITVALMGCASVQQADDADQATQTSASAMSAETSEELKEELGAFDIAAEQRELAKTNEAGYEPLDAGRGNPNWINTKARLAFTRQMDFAVDECQRDMSEGDMAGHCVAEGVSERFDAAMDPADETDKFLIDAIDYCVKDLGMNKDDLLMELTNGIIGDYYPSPSRCLELTEAILNEYLQSTLYNGVDLKGETQVFPTEGGSAAMCYVFHSLEHSYVLKPGDKIALATPIFCRFPM